MNEVNKRNDAEMRAVAAIANSGNDQAVVILNLNLYIRVGNISACRRWENYVEAASAGASYW